MARLLADENFPLQAVLQLRDLGHDVLTLNDARLDNSGMTDGDVLEWASSDGRAVLTLDRRDFLRLHRTAPAHAGIVACTANTDHIEFASRIHAALLQEPTLAGKLLRVVRPDR